MLDVITGYGCNITCDYCTITEEMRARALTTEQIVRSLKTGRRLGHDTVQIGGGEPTVRGDLGRLVRAARKLGYRDVKIQSNGLRYAHAAYVDALVRAGATSFAISLMSHLPDLYESITGFPRAQERVLQGLANLQRHPVPIVGDVIMKDDTYRHLPELVAFYVERGVRDFVLWLVSVTDRNAAFPESLVPVRVMYPFIREAVEGGAALGARVRSRHIPPCMLPGLEDHLVDTLAEAVRVVTPDGEFDLRDSRISANSYLPVCGSCARRATCPGIRADYLEQVGDSEVVPWTTPPATS